MNPDINPDINPDMNSEMDPEVVANEQEDEKLSTEEIECELEMGDDPNVEAKIDQIDLGNGEASEVHTPSPNAVAEVLEWVKLIAIALFLGWLLTTFVIQRNTVKGRSMEPTLQSGDELFVEKISLYFTAISRGDIITVDTHGLDPREPNRVIKRVIGLPGETVRIAAGKVYVNDQELDEPYLEGDGQNLDVITQPDMEITLEADQYFCLGDNRPFSKDSRVFGPIPKENILGKVLVRMYPFDKFGRP